MKKYLWALGILAGIIWGGAASAGYGWAADAPNSKGQSLPPAHTAEAYSANKQEQAKIRLRFGNESLVVMLENNSASRDLVSLLPLTLHFEDYSGTEKIGYPPRKLDTQDAPSSCTPSVGSFTYYAPWGNLAIFYKDFRHSNGLVPLGRIESGTEKLAGMHGNFSVRLERLE
ncbi:MAG: cyclophilin-like fold protein [Desulfovibrionaceae bacterium]|nr:cyclophilin-like fold protein [Desulfovibrionaceae bacterium]